MLITQHRGFRPRYQIKYAYAEANIVDKLKYTRLTPTSMCFMNDNNDVIDVLFYEPEIVGAKERMVQIITLLKNNIEVVDFDEVFEYAKVVFDNINKV